MMIMQMEKEKVDLVLLINNKLIYKELLKTENVFNSFLVIVDILNP